MPANTIKINNSDKEEKEVNTTIHGVLSKIEFPLGQDDYAVSRAIHLLLSKGWEFAGVTKTHLSFVQKCDVVLSESNTGK